MEEAVECLSELSNTLVSKSTSFHWKGEARGFPSLMMITHSSLTAVRSCFLEADPYTS